MSTLVQESPYTRAEKKAVNSAIATATVSDALHVRIKATAQDWQKLMIARARATAASSEAKALETAMGIPDAETLARDFKLPGTDGKATLHVVDGNGFPLGRLSLFWFGGSVTPAAYRKRIS